MCIYYNTTSDTNDSEVIDGSQNDDCSTKDTDLFELELCEPVIDVSVPCTIVYCVGSKFYQPQDSSIFSKLKKYGSGKNAHKRHFKPAWFRSYLWLLFCLTPMRVYCHYRKHACESNVTVLTTKAASAFSVDGFCNWKNAITKFKDDKSQAHRDTVATYIVSRHVPVSQQLKAHYNQTQVRRRESLIKQIYALYYLLCQG